MTNSESNTPAPISHGLGWKLIGTAPTDGRDLLLTSSDWNGDVMVGSFAFGKWRERPSPDGASMTPTHWMHIPPLSVSSAIEAEELSEINAALKTIQSTCLQLQYDHSGRYGAETIDPLRDVAKLINKLVFQSTRAALSAPEAEG